MERDEGSTTETVPGPSDVTTVLAASTSQGTSAEQQGVSGHAPLATIQQAQMKEGAKPSVLPSTCF